MKDKINRFLLQQVNMEHTITACMVTFLCTVVLIVAWLIVLAGSFGNLVNTVKFAQILSITDRVYIGQSDSDDVSDAAFDAMIESLGDRWSYYMDREEYERYQQVQSNRYTGIGITLQKEERGWLIVSVASNSPAAKAGIQADTYLVKVNGTDVFSLESSDISAVMRETPNDVTVVTEDQNGNRKSFSLVLEEIYTNPVSYELMEETTGYIRLENFDETCAEQAIEAVETLMEQGAVSLIFDVRSNGGGYVTEMCDLLDYLLPEGEIFVFVDHEGNETVTESDEDCIDLPMAVLVNENSYSAAEFFAAALREYEAAAVVGMPTTGKNRSQSNWILMDGSAVHLSSKCYLTPNRVDLTQQGGITPDFVVEYGENDPQLAAALELFHENKTEFG